jgi:hypothetical protein
VPAFQGREIGARVDARIVVLARHEVPAREDPAQRGACRGEPTFLLCFLLELLLPLGAGFQEEVEETLPPGLDHRILGLAEPPEQLVTRQHRHRQIADPSGRRHSSRTLCGVGTLWALTGGDLRKALSFWERTMLTVRSLVHEGPRSLTRETATLRVTTDALASSVIELGFIDLIGIRAFNNHHDQDAGDELLGRFAASCAPSRWPARCATAATSSW